MGNDRDILHTVGRAANLALTTQTAHNDGMQRLAEATTRIEARWDELEQAIVDERQKVADLEGRLSTALDDNAALIADHASQMANERRDHGVQIQALQEKARDDIAEVRRVAEDEIASVQQVATKAIEDAAAENAALVARLRAQLAEVSTHNNELLGQVEILRFDNDHLSQGVNLLLTATQNTSRAMLEEDAQINALVDRLSSRLDNSPNVISQALSKTGEVVPLFDLVADRGEQSSVRVA